MATNEHDDTHGQNQADTASREALKERLRENIRQMSITRSQRHGGGMTPVETSGVQGPTRRRSDNVKLAVLNLDDLPEPTSGDTGDQADTDVTTPPTERRKKDIHSAWKITVEPADELTEKIADIRRQLQECQSTVLEAFLKAGRILVKAKEYLGHGNFTKALRAGDLGVDERTAQKLMKISEQPALANPTNSSVLPSAQESLYHLSTMDSDALDRLLKNGKVKPGMTTKEIKAICRGDKRQGQAGQNGGAHDAGGDGRGEDDGAQADGEGDPTEGDDDTAEEPPAPTSVSEVSKPTDDPVSEKDAQAVNGHDDASGKPNLDDLIREDPAGLLQMVLNNVWNANIGDTDRLGGFIDGLEAHAKSYRKQFDRLVSGIAMSRGGEPDPEES